MFKRFQSTNTSAIEAIEAIVYAISDKDIPLLSPKIQHQLNITKYKPSLYNSRLLYGLDESPIVAIVGLGNDVNPDNVRNAIHSVTCSIRDLSKSQNLKISYQTTHHPQSIAEGAYLSSYSFQQLQYSKKDEYGNVEFSPLDKTPEIKSQWQVGSIAASAQNLTRFLAETPANLMTPTIFCDNAKKLLSNQKNVKINVYDRAWAEEKKMGALLSVTSGSDEPCKFLELIYTNDFKDPSKIHSLVGKGVTFDSGGISIKPSAEMALMKGDMAGAATVLSAFHAAVQMKLEINLVAVIPLTENMINGHATKPGDVVTAMNGKTIEVDNTDAEGRLILADAITYVSQMWKPKSIVELSTLTGAMDVALGYPFAGVFTNSDSLWEKLRHASLEAGDSFWRMPLSDKYKTQISSNVADLKNIGGRGAGACTAAIFLKQFIHMQAQETGKEFKKQTPFAHIDIAGVFHKKAGDDKLANGMTGRPTRSLIQYLINLSSK